MLVAPERFWVNSTSFAYSSLVIMMKNSVFNDYFKAFFIIFDHANAGRNTQEIFTYLHIKFHLEWP